LQIKYRFLFGSFFVCVKYIKITRARSVA